MSINVLLCSGFLPLKSCFFSKDVTVYTVDGTRFANGEWNITPPTLETPTVICQNFDADIHARWAELWMVLQRWPKHVPCVIGVPFLGYMRQSDMFRAWVHLLQSYGPVVCVDPHEEEASLHSVYPDWGKVLTHHTVHEYVLVSPDRGRCHRVKYLAQHLGCPGISLHKTRQGLSMHLEWSDPKDAYWVKDRICLVRDDMVDSGKTLYHVAEFLHRAGGRAVYVGVSHILRPWSAYHFLCSEVQKFFVANTTVQAQTCPTRVDVLSQWWTKCLNVMDGLLAV